MTFEPVEIGHRGDRRCHQCAASANYLSLLSQNSKACDVELIQSSRKEQDASSDDRGQKKAGTATKRGCSACWCTSTIIPTRT